MLPDIPSLAAQHPVLTTIAFLYSLRKVCAATKSAVMDAFGIIEELNHGLLKLIAACYANWCRCKARISKLRAREQQLVPTAPRAIARSDSALAANSACGTPKIKAGRRYS